jgi:hypothetical protein
MGTRQYRDERKGDPIARVQSLAQKETDRLQQEHIAEQMRQLRAGEAVQPSFEWTKTYQKIHQQLMLEIGLINPI